jgi:SPP1 gp7 family putative phage head morphogenesis protein
VAKKKKAPKVIPLDTIRGSRDYFRDLKRVTDAANRATAKILTLLDSLELSKSEDENKQLDKVDAFKPSKKLKSKQQRIREAIARAQAEFTRSLDIDDVRKTIAKNANRIDTQNRQQIFKQAKAAIGVERLVNPKTTKERATFVKENVSLIKTIGPEHFAKIQKIVDEGFAKGTRSSVLKERIQAVGGVTERRAALIARDQVGSLNANLARTRHMANGFDSFIWTTVGDDRVRDEHEAINGQTFPYATGAPGEGFPGDPINCRCFAAPVFKKKAS